MGKISVEIFNEELVSEVEPTFNLSFEDIKKGYEKIFADSPLDDVNIVFVENAFIQELNKTYRDIDAPTDVLSFDLSHEDKNGEIYICPAYVYEGFQGDKFEEEILRLIVHGTLHMLGYDHKESMNDSPNEEMFVMQEELLLRLKKICS